MSELVVPWVVFGKVFRWYRAEARMRVRGLNNGGVPWLVVDCREVLG